MVEIRAAGAVLWRPAGTDGVRIALVHRPRHDDWSLPKGKLERGETLWSAAAREVTEETGFRPVLGRYLTRVSYPLSQPVAATKTVDYVAARARAGQFRPNREVDELRWVPAGEAAALLTYPHDVAVVRGFCALPPDPVTVALVRHARAGKRDIWPGPDVQRPLSAEGWRQTAALSELLPLFGCDRVHSAPLVRCVQTVWPLAEAIETPIDEEPLLSERGYAGHRQEAVTRLRQIAAAGGTPVVCSQGGVIPHLLSRLAGDAGLPLAAPESRKGSVWLLSFSREPDPRLLAANYIIPRLAMG